MKTSNVEWGWMPSHSERAYGPFSTRDEAVEDAHAHGYGLNDGIIVGVCIWADPVAALPSMDEFLERLEDYAQHNGFGFWDDEVFEVQNPKDARAEFDVILRTWAEKHMSANCWTLIPNSDLPALSGAAVAGDESEEG